MRFIAMLTALLLFAVPVRAGDIDSGWRLTQSVGDVAVSSAGGFTLVALKPSDPLPVEAVVSTGATGRAILVRGNETVILAPQTRITLPKTSYADRTILLQNAGRALFQIGKKPVAHFEVKTPYLAAVVKGTTFEVDVAAEAAVVDVTEGAVEVSDFAGNARTLVRGGHRIRIDLNGTSKTARSQGSKLAPAHPAATAPALTPAVVVEPAGSALNPAETSAGMVEVETEARKDDAKTSTGEMATERLTASVSKTVTGEPASSRSTVTPETSAPKDTGTGAPRETAALEPAKDTSAGTEKAKDHESGSGSGSDKDTAAESPKEKDVASVPDNPSGEAGSGPDMSDPRDHGRSEEAPGHTGEAPGGGTDKKPDSPPGLADKEPKPAKPEKPGKGKSKT